MPTLPEGQDLLNIAALGITAATFAARVSIADAGADTFVAGSAIFGQPDYRSVIDAMRSALA